MTNKFRIILLSITVLIIFSCSAPTEESTDENSQNAEANVEMEMPSEAAFQFDLIIANNIASPVKLISDMNTAGLNTYQDGITNPTENLSKYVTANEKALSFGIYGADLSYKSIHNRNEDMAAYLLAIRNLAEDLGLNQLFDEETMETFDRIKSNPDSIKLFIFDKYDQADAFLRGNDRLLTASLILTGGLIESLHLASSQIESSNSNNEAYLIFLEQKNTLKSLLNLYETLEAEGKMVPVRADVELLYNKFKEVESYEMFSKENMAPLHQSIDQVRNKLV